MDLFSLYVLYVISPDVKQRKTLNLNTNCAREADPSVAFDPDQLPV